MAIDYNKFSDADLEAVANEKYDDLSDEALQHIAEQAQPNENPTGSVGAQIAGPAVGALATAGHYVKPALKGAYHALSNPGIDLAAYLAAKTKMGQSVMQGAKALPGQVGAALGETGAAPAAALAAPYMMAAHEQSKIRANPNAPEYANNPYAMSVRSQGTQQPLTQGQAGAMNRRAALTNMSTAGNPAMPPVAPPAPQAAPQPQQPPQPPTAMNFIQRMKQLADQYSPATNFLQS